MTLGAYLLYNWSVTQVKVTLAAAYVNLIPVFTLLLAYLLLGRRWVPCNGLPAPPCWLASGSVSCPWANTGCAAPPPRVDFPQSATVWTGTYAGHEGATP